MKNPDGSGVDTAADGYNAGYAEQLYERELRGRGLIPPSLVDLVEGGGPVPAPAAAGPAALDADRLRIAAVAGGLVRSYRDQGHLAVPLDPLGAPPPGHPSLKPEFHGITEPDLASLPAAAVGLERMGPTVLDVVHRLREIYCGPIGYELDHMENPAQWDWLVDAIESGRHRRPFERADALDLLERLSAVEGMERFLHRSYLGQKRFSIEGLDMLVPMLDEAIRRAVAGGTRVVLIGMAHRGRLNVLSHIIGRPYEAIMGEFEGEPTRGMQTTVLEAGSGDVKYHLGAREMVETPAGAVEIFLAPNPSHLEHVNPVIEGMARAAREQIARGWRSEGGAIDEPSPASGPVRRFDTAHGTGVLPVLIHGDSAFIGQGVVAETLNLCRLDGYETGGTLHFVANNQLGFTTDPGDSRSTRYASDLALAFRVPILHVNADDPEACLAAVRLGIDYRTEFGEDIVIDLVGYRRYGHNEGDEPGYTQPLMYERIHGHPSVRDQWMERLAERGLVTRAEADAMADAVAERLNRAREAVRDRSDAREPAADGEGGEAPAAGPTGGPEGRAEASTPSHPHAGLTEEREETDTRTAVPADRLAALNEKIHAWPEGFALFQKLDRQLERRKKAIETAVDWAHAETLAFASLLTDGVPVRLSGEDSERGTFSQRHLVLHDVRTGERFVPLEHLEPDQAPFQVWNSPLSEVAVLGFEYGYSTVATNALVLWEAQFGDFANVAQAMIDQFIVAGRAKWGQESRLVLLLPHGYEGQGPEHSSARVERFLDLAARGNIRVANCTTPAQYFHLLRRQALRHARRPLVVLTPKSLLRHPGARSTLEDLAEGGFEPVLADPAAPAVRDDPASVRRLILCSGKIYYDLAASDARAAADGVELLRLELLYPFPEHELAKAFARFPALEEIVWVQEEPENMGAWGSISDRLRCVIGPDIGLRYVGRPRRASPAEGYAAEHAREQARIVGEAFATHEEG
ncbi:MAG: 2-oxoglutarate dehydrogenase E1 component [Gemmatimonadota bacterium]